MTTSIEWTRGDDGSPGETWNPVRGCSLVSAGCTNCYAMKQAHRFSGPGQPYEGLTRAREKNGPTWTGAVRFVSDALDKPLERLKDAEWAKEHAARCDAERDRDRLRAQIDHCNTCDGDGVMMTSEGWDGGGRG